MNITVLLESGPLTLSAEPGQSLLDVLREHEGLPIHAPCGGQGTCEKCTVYLSGYVGGDITADMLAAGQDRAATPSLLIDVGANGEMALGRGDKFVCCSTAAGPALEGPRSASA